MKKIYITDYTFICGIEDKRFNFRIARKNLTKKLLIKGLKAYNPDGIIAGLEIYDKEIFNVCPNLKVISRIGSGIDNINEVDAKKYDIKILNTPDEPVQAVAELVIAQMINILRRLPNYYADDMLDSHEGRDFSCGRDLGKRLSDCKIGIIGYGHIGQKVYKLLQPFQVKNIFINDINIIPNNTTLDILLKECDIITIHIPMNKNNENFINKEKINKMKNGVILINTSRGGIINEDDLYEGLDIGKIDSVALDVFKDEPYIGKLRNFSTVYSTPHIGSYTEETRKAMELKAFQNIVDYLLNN